MVRLKDVAAAAGVSVTTVSRVLNGTADAVGIAAETQDRIRSIARSLNYRPNREARNLRLGRRPQALLFLSLYEGRTHGQEGFLSHPFYGEMMHGIQAEVSDAGYYLAYVAVSSTNVREIRELVHNTVSGVITWGTLPDDLTGILKEAKLPVAAIEPYTLGDGAFQEIYVENDQAVFQAVEHLHECGYRHIAMADMRLNGDRQNPVFEERVEAFQHYTGRHEGLKTWVEVYEKSTGVSDIYAGELIGQRICAEIHGRTGVVAVNDMVAMGVMNAAEKTGVEVPGTLGIVGIDDIEWARFLHRPLTTVSIPKRQLAKEAVEYLCRRLDQGKRPGQVVRVPVELVVRDTTLACP